MKKVIFYPVLLALILANILVYSCKQENPVTTASAMEELTTEDRSAPCSPLTIYNAVGFGICNIDNGPFLCAEPCSGATTPNVPADQIATNPQSFAFLNSNVFSLTNPDPNNAVNVGIAVGVCNNQVFLIPAGGTRTFRVTFNPFTGCCVVTSPC